MSDGMGRELAYLSSHATNRYFIPNCGRFVNSTWAFYTENSTRTYYKYDFTNNTSGKYWYYKGTDNTNKFDFTYTADNKKLK